MKKLYRVLRLVLFACLTVGLFAGCDQSGNSGGGTEGGGNGKDTVVEGKWEYSIDFTTYVNLYVKEVEEEDFDAVIVKETFVYTNHSYGYGDVTAASAGLARKENGAYYVDFGEGEAKLVFGKNKITYTVGGVSTEFTYNTELDERWDRSSDTFVARKNKNDDRFIGRLRYSADRTQGEFFESWEGEHTPYSVFWVDDYVVCLDDDGNIVYLFGTGVWKHNFELEEDETPGMKTMAFYTINVKLGDHGKEIVFSADTGVDLFQGYYSHNDEIQNMTVCYGDTIRLPSVKPEAGYLFKGWNFKYQYDSGDPVYYGEAGALYTVKGLYPTFTAVYDVIEYTLTYSDGADAEGEVTGMPEAGGTISLESGELTLPAAPHRDGYTFAGWTLNGKTLGETYTLTEEDIPKEGKEIVITAAWTAE